MLTNLEKFLLELSLPGIDLRADWKVISFDASGVLFAGDFLMDGLYPDSFGVWSLSSDGNCWHTGFYTDDHFQARKDYRERVMTNDRRARDKARVQRRWREKKARAERLHSIS
jgi:hypothetical protein